MSHLAHVWREPNHYLHEQLRERPTVLEALGDRLLRVAMTDVPARFPGTDPLPFRQSHPPLDVVDFPTWQAAYEQAPLSPRKGLAHRAQRQLQRLDFAGTVESLDLLAARLAAVMGCGTYPGSGTTPDRAARIYRLADRNPEELAALDAVNEVDRLLCRSFDRGRLRTRLGLSTRGGRRAGH